MANRIGMDLGGTNLRAALFDHDGRPAKKLALEMPPDPTPEQAVDVLADTVGKLLGRGRSSGTIGLASAGQIDHDTGAIVYSPNHDWHDVPVAAMLHERTGMNVVVENDVNAAALGEYYFGAGEKNGDMAAVFVGTGIGGGFVFDGKIYLGEGAAAEIGHMPYRPGGVLCGCGKRGCFEAYAGGVNIGKRYNRALSRIKKNAPRASAKDVARLAREGDELASKYWNEALEALSTLAVTLAASLNPRTIVIGGAIGTGTSGLVALLQKAVKERATTVAARTTKIKKARTGKMAGVLGASLLGVKNP